MTWKEGWSSAQSGLAFEARLAAARTRSSGLQTAFARVIDIPLGLWCAPLAKAADAAGGGGSTRRSRARSR